MTLLLQVALLLGVGAFVLAPLLQMRGRRIAREAAVVNLHRSIAERKTRLYTQLLDLDFDRDSGKLSPEDHARMREETMAEVLQVLAEEERMGGIAPGPPLAPAPRAAGAAADDRVERLIEDVKRRRAASIESEKA